MSTPVPIKPATTLFIDQSHTSSSNTPATLLTLFEISLLIYPPYILTLCLDVLLDPTYNQRKSLPRSQNSWILFRKDFEGRLRAQFPDKSFTIHEVSKIAGNQWKVQPGLVKAYFGVLSKLAQERHKRAYPDYVYKPRRTKQRKRNGEYLFKNMNKDTFTSRQNNRVHAYGTIRDTNTIQNVDECYRVNESNGSMDDVNTDERLVCEAHNDPCLESSSQEDNNDMCHDASSIQVPSSDNVYNDTTDIDNSSIYLVDQTMPYSTYDPFTFPTPNLFSNTNMMVSAPSNRTYDTDFFNVNAQQTDNNGQTWPYDINGYKESISCYSIMYDNN
ncbi:2226_t:CDS:1, partial [Paraglomus brasilianum]